MQDFTTSLKQLIDDELIDRPTAFQVAPNREALKMALKGINVSQPGILLMPPNCYCDHCYLWRRDVITDRGVGCLARTGRGEWRSACYRAWAGLLLQPAQDFPDRLHLLALDSLDFLGQPRHTTDGREHRSACQRLESDCRFDVFGRVLTGDGRADFLGWVSAATVVLFRAAGNLHGNARQTCAAHVQDHDVCRDQEHLFWW